MSREFLQGFPPPHLNGWNTTILQDRPASPPHPQRGARAYCRSERSRQYHFLFAGVPGYNRKPARTRYLHPENPGCRSGRSAGISAQEAYRQYRSARFSRDWFRYQWQGSFSWSCPPLHHGSRNVERISGSFSKASLRSFPPGALELRNTGGSIPAARSFSTVSAESV